MLTAPPLLTIYRSSAGSGKTFTLVREYLKIALAQPQEFKHILAITFTVKATEEIKMRILRELADIISKNPTKMKERLLAALENTISAQKLEENALSLQRLILHQYPDFAISTIDSFFQKVIRAFAREINLPLQFELQTELDFAIQNGLQMLIEKVGVGKEKDPELTNWLLSYIRYKIYKDGNWNIKESLMQLAKELFNENFQQISAKVFPTQNQFETRELLHKLIIQLRERISSLTAEIESNAQCILNSIYEARAESACKKREFLEKIESFQSKNFLHLEDERKLKIFDNLKDLLSNDDNWFKKSLKKSEAQALERVDKESIKKRLEKIYNAYTLIQEYQEVEDNLYAFGILSDLETNIENWLDQNNLLLIAQTNAKVKHILQNSSTPFLYEKTGSRFYHFLLDEFQDTSALQWENLLPLLENSMAQGYSSLIVGDVKQAIYRWRGGRYQLLASEVEQDLQHFQDGIINLHLDTNYRSLANIVRFNNTLFSHLPKFAAQYSGLEKYTSAIIKAFEAATQNIAPHHKNTAQGYVELSFWKEEKNDSNSVEEDYSKSESEEDNSKYAPILSLVWQKIQKLLGLGYTYSNMVLLVRRNEEAQACAEYLLNKGVAVVTPESLQLKNSPPVRFLVLLIAWIANQIEPIQKIELYLLYLEYIYPFSSEEEKKATLLHHLEKNEWNNILPLDFFKKLDFLKHLSLIELVQELIVTFNIAHFNDAFILFFQDKVLEFQQQHGTNLQSFLNWWEKQGKHQSIITPKEKDAIRIMTFHKSKGLEFGIVFVPFIDWSFKPKSGTLKWYEVKTIEEYHPFSYFPLRYKKILCNTRFAQQYQREQFLELLDNLNLLYVAFTRPIEKLYLYAPLPKEENFSQEVGALLYSFFVKCAATISHFDDNEKYVMLSEHWNAAKNIFYFGNEEELPLDEKQKKTNIQGLTNFPRSYWRSIVTIQRCSSDLEELLGSAYEKKLNFGRVLHDILAQMKNLEDLEKLIEEQYLQGHITLAQKQEVKEKINFLFSLPQFQEWFAPIWQVKTEHSIITPNGEIYRPDRVLTQGLEKAIVIDYKTGSPAPYHQTQIKNYAHTLRNMGYQEVNAFLVYTSLHPPIQQVQVS
ncbi:MAG: UvrD-helicase domain-containing protein [Bacteroidia bacterium]|nr:UvrD-helicase domain-containing protein [Bacteroidia bacterium]MDW8157531.1 UvrD-helicase domain-containing protein [Bacteroidia bacterium]